MTDMEARLLVLGAHTPDQMREALVSIFRALNFADTARQIDIEWDWVEGDSEFPDGFPA